MTPNRPMNTAARLAAFLPGVTLRTAQFGGPIVARANRRNRNGRRRLPRHNAACDDAIGCTAED